MLAVRSSSFSVHLPSRPPLPFHALDFHESNDATQVAIPFAVIAGVEEVSGVTTPGTALGTGQKINFPADTSHFIFSIAFALTTDQWVGVSEVRIATPTVFLGNPIIWRFRIHFLALKPIKNIMRSPLG